MSYEGPHGACDRRIQALEAENERLRKWAQKAQHWCQVAYVAPDEIERGKRLLDARLCLDAALSTPEETEP